jgi:hypothetical protein
MMNSEVDCPIGRERVRRLRQHEDRSFASRTKGSAKLALRAKAHMPGSVPMAWMKGLYRTPPLYVTHGQGARFFDVDGNGYLDFNVADLSMTMRPFPARLERARTSFLPPKTRWRSQKSWRGATVCPSGSSRFPHPEQTPK